MQDGQLENGCRAEARGGVGEVQLEKKISEDCLGEGEAGTSCEMNWNRASEKAMQILCPEQQNYFDSQ